MTKPKKPKATKADGKAKHTAVLREAATMAKSINVRLEKAAKMESDAFDHRLAAAIELGNVKTKLDKAGIGFKDWYAGNITAVGRDGKALSYETVRKLAAVGMEKDPKAALESARGKNAKANQNLRQRQSAERATEPNDPPAARALKALESMRPQDRMNLVKEAARDMKMTIVPASPELQRGEPKDQVSRDPSPVAIEGGLDGMKAAFTALRATDRMRFVEWAALEVGVKVHNPFQADDDGLGIPPALKRVPASPEPQRGEQAA